MPFNGSGTFVRVYNWTNDANGGINIRADRTDTETDGIATGLSTAICKDGQTTTTARIPFASGLGASDGTAGSPSIVFNSETSTGLYRSAAGNLDIAVLGSRVGGLTETGINNTAIGATTRAAGNFTTVNANARGTFQVGVNVGNTASATVTDLDWYEEGTFAPVIVGDIVGGVGTYTTQLGRYTRIGRLVQFEIHLIWTAHTGSGGMRVQGLPFTSNAVMRVPVTGSYSNFLVTAAREFTPMVEAAASQILMFNSDPAGGVNAFFAIDTAGTLLLSGLYSV